MLTRASTTLADGTRIEDLIDVENREVSMRVLADDELYQLEMERIFGQTWLLLAHESEIPNSGDFVVRNMGDDSVIVARDRSGDIHVSLNVCAHRGMRLCMSEAGNAQVHRCIYHGWAFRNDGTFLGSPVEREHMHGDIRQKSELGLAKARTQLYGGLIFATWNLDGPSFDDFLGEMKWYYDMLFCRTDGGLEVLGPPQRFMINANWKAAAEQSASDGFHTLTLHRSLMETGLMGGSGDSIYDQAPAMYGIDVGSPHGHSLRCMRAETIYSMFIGRDDMQAMSVDERLELLPPPGIVPELLPQVRRHMDETQLKMLATSPPQVGGMFPNVLIAFIYAPTADGSHSGALSLHAYVPHGPNQVEFINWVFAEKDAPEAMKRSMLANAIRQTGTSGTIEQDDAIAWPYMSKAARGFKGRQQTLKYQALLGENKPEGWPGGAFVYDGFTKDDTQWNWWLYYRELMTAV